MAKRDIFGEVMEGAAAMKSHREGKLCPRYRSGCRASCAISSAGPTMQGNFKANPRQSGEEGLYLP
jgi:hypothetical protein